MYCFYDIKKYFFILLFVPLIGAAQDRDAKIDSLQKKLPTLSNPQQISTALYNIAINYDALNKSDSAMRYYLKVLKTENRSGQSKNSINAQYGIGNIYIVYRNFEKAIQYFQEAIDLCKQKKDSTRIIAAINGIGNAYYCQNKDTLAKIFFLEVLRLEKKYEKNALPDGYINMGAVDNDLKQYDEALGYYQQALKIYEIKNDKSGIAIASLNIGNTYDEKGDYKQALHYDTLGMNGAKKIHATDLILNAFSYIAEADSGLGMMNQAFAYMKKYADYKDTVVQISSAKSMADMQEKYETDKKQKAIELLTQKNKVAALDAKQKKYFFNTAVAGCLVLILIIFIVYNRYRLKQKANEKLETAYHEIDVKNKIVEEKNKDITDSIRYAKRIQMATLPTTAFADYFKNNAFILYKPKDIVSGDFYWMEKKETKIFIAAVDCTGHGVPGAFMSIVGYNLLNQIVNEHNITQPAMILNELNKGVTQTLRQTVEESIIKDGMDISLCAIDFDKNEMEFAGAYNPLWIIRDKQLIEIKSDKRPIGNFMGEESSHFTNHKIDLKSGDQLYLFTDGYADQFGGPKGKKFKYKLLQETLLANNHKTMDEQQKIFSETINNWKGNLEQVDDILLIGIKV